jgi:site-specific recombinase XerD
MQTPANRYQLLRRHDVTIQEAIELFEKHQNVTVRKSTLKSYGKFLERFKARFFLREVVSVTADEIGKFLEECAETLSRSTRHLRYAQLKAFFNYVIEASDMNIKNPCNAGVLFKTFKDVCHRPRKILDKETVDEIIFNSQSVRDRLILELQARCGLRIGEVLNLRASDASGRKLMIQEPKSGSPSQVGMRRSPLCRNTLQQGLPSIFRPSRCRLRTGCFLSAIPRRSSQRLF